ncbi:hypothetical protein ACF08O_04175 [Streptomyces paradoxus]|uniref:hypothetical protein n=1 Tax=Streptomyces paradoxus TaxID=66375 RepID=UPI0036FE33C2
MTARNDDDRRQGERGGGAEYDGTDALMAVLAGAPLPEEARRDRAFMAAHDSAAADVALLRRHLGLIGDALAGPGAPAEPTATAPAGPRTADPAAPGAAIGSQERAPSARPEPIGAITERSGGDGGGGSPVPPRPERNGLPAERRDGDASGVRPVSAGSGRVSVERGDAGGGSPVPGVSAGLGASGASAVAGDGDAGGVTPVSAGSGSGGTPAAAEGGDARGGARVSSGPAGAVVGEMSAGRGGEAGVDEGPAVASLSSRRRTRSKTVTVALKGLVAAVGASVVIGMGWLVVQSGGMSTGGDQGASSAADSSAGRPQTEADAKLTDAGYLACARLVVEGTVAEVESVPGTGQDRITLDVTRYYKPDKGRPRITFPLETGAIPSLRAGEHMLVGISGDQARPDTWATGEKDIARERARITEALPHARTLPCP